MINLIICGDLHCSNASPKCRIDDYQEAFWGKMAWLRQLSEKHDCPVVFPGDVFDKSRVPQKLEVEAITKFPEFIAVPGQHDLLYHSINNYGDSSLAVLAAARPDCFVFTPDNPSLEENGMNIEGFWWEADLLRFGRKKKKGRNIAILHKMVWSKQLPYPGCTADSASQLMNQLEKYDLIITGDNHTGFIVSKEGRHLVNCGSFMRSTADQVGHKPFVVLYDAEANTIKKVYIPIKAGVISRQHIEKALEKEQRTASYVKHLKKGIEAGLSFRDNIEKALERENNSRVKEIIRESLG